MCSAGNAGRYFYCTERGCGGGGGWQKHERVSAAVAGRAAQGRVGGCAGGERIAEAGKEGAYQQCQHLFKLTALNFSCSLCTIYGRRASVVDG